MGNEVLSELTSKHLSAHLCVRSVAVLQPQTDAAAEQEAGSVHLAAVGRQHRPPDHDPHVAQLAGRLHQQLALQLGRQQLLRTPVCRRTQVSHLIAPTVLPTFPSPSLPPYFLLYLLICLLITSFLSCLLVS